MEKHINSDGFVYDIDPIAAVAQAVANIVQGGGGL